MLGILVTAEGAAGAVARQFIPGSGVEKLFEPYTPNHPHCLQLPYQCPAAATLHRVSRRGGYERPVDQRADVHKALWTAIPLLDCIAQCFQHIHKDNRFSL